MREYSHVLYHGNCYDGFGAAFAAWLYLSIFSDEVEYIPVLHGQPVPDLPADAVVLLVDFAYPRAELEALNERVAHLTVLDHHKTAQADLEGLDYALFDMNKSGAVLAWEHFHEDKVPLFFLYLQDRDLWKFELPGSKGVSQALRAYPFDFGVWFTLMSVERLQDEAGVIERFTEQMVKLMADQATMREVGGHQVPVTNASLFFSEVADELVQRYPGAPFAAYYFDRGDGIRQWGFRSRTDFDCSEVAKQLGGGGHAQAAGFQEPIPGFDS